MTDAVVPVASDDELSDDIRLLGRLLGDVIRRQAGEPTFELVEKVRRLTREGVSVNAWLVRAVSAAVDGGTRPRPQGKAQNVGQSFTGWVR